MWGGICCGKHQLCDQKVIKFKSVIKWSQNLFIRLFKLKNLLVIYTF